MKAKGTGSNLFDRAVLRVRGPRSPLVEEVQGDEERGAQRGHGGGQREGDVPEENHVCGARSREEPVEGVEGGAGEGGVGGGGCLCCLNTDTAGTECCRFLSAACDRAPPACFRLRGKKEECHVQGQLVNSACALDSSVGGDKSAI